MRIRRVPNRIGPIWIIGTLCKIWRIDALQPSMNRIGKVESLDSVLTQLGTCQGAMEVIIVTGILVP